MKKSDKLTINEILTGISYGRYGRQKKRNGHTLHSVGYGNSRGILTYIKKQKDPVAFAYNPGNGIVIFTRHGGGTLAYGGIYRGFPILTPGNGNFIWNNIREVDKAIDLIKEDIWTKSYYDRSINYADSFMRDGWTKEYEGYLLLLPHRDNVLLMPHSQLKSKQPDNIENHEISIVRTKSNRLKIFVERVCRPVNKITSALSKVNANDINEDHFLSTFPAIVIGWGKYLLIKTVPRMDKNLIDELAAESVRKKFMKATKLR